MTIALAARRDEPEFVGAARAVAPVQPYPWTHFTRPRVGRRHAALRTSGQTNLASVAFSMVTEMAVLER